MEIRVAYYGYPSSIGILKEKAKNFIENEKKRLLNADVIGVSTDADYVFVDNRLWPDHYAQVKRLHPKAIINWITVD